jgi:O-methyltransferase
VLRRGSTSDVSRFENAWMINLAIQYVADEHIDGDYHEFGVYRGSAFVEAWRAIHLYGLPYMFHAYDSFQGLPPTRDEGQFQVGDFAADQATFEAELARRKVPPDRVTITPGFFDQTLPTAERRPCAVALVECDTCESTVPVLEYLAETLADGAVVCFDDWFSYRGRPDRGE